jgi:hypothetical protein
VKTAGGAGAVYGAWTNTNAAVEAFTKENIGVGLAYSAAALLSIIAGALLFNPVGGAIGATIVGATAFGAQTYGDMLNKKSEELQNTAEELGPGKMTMKEKNELRSKLIEAIQLAQKAIKEGNLDPETIRKFESKIQELMEALSKLY